MNRNSGGLDQDSGRGKVWTGPGQDRVDTVTWRAAHIRDNNATSGTMTAQWILDTESRFPSVTGEGRSGAGDNMQHPAAVDRDPGPGTS